MGECKRLSEASLQIEHTTRTTWATFELRRMLLVVRTGNVFGLRWHTGYDPEDNRMKGRRPFEFTPVNRFLVSNFFL